MKIHNINLTAVSVDTDAFVHRKCPLVLGPQELDDVILAVTNVHIAGDGGRSLAVCVIGDDRESVYLQERQGAYRVKDNVET